MKNESTLISILVAVRNEEKHIQNCLASLAKLKDQNFEVRIGDDSSTDRSTEIIQNFIIHQPNFFYQKIEIQKKLKGKANVIHQLITEAKGEYIAQIDADTVVSPDWLPKMRKHLKKNLELDMLMATTIPRKQSEVENQLLSWQQVDWLFGQSVVWIMAKVGLPQTAMGNNLIYKKSAYYQVGTYLQIPVSVTEDMALFRIFREKKCSFNHILDEKTLALTEAQDSFENWLTQRHRWMFGIWELSSFLKKIGLLAALFNVLFLFLMFFAVGLEAVLCLWAIQLVWICLFYTRLRIKIPFLSLLFYVLAFPFLYFLVGIRLIIKQNVFWKGRAY